MDTSEKEHGLDTKFSIALHVLVLISESQTPLSSLQIAQSVGTNPSFVRKVLGQLKKGGVIESQQGKAGFRLTRSAQAISLFQIYQAVYDANDIELFGIHKNPNDACIVGRYIQPTLDGVFGAIEQQTKTCMEQTSLADCIGQMRNMAVADGVEVPSARGTDSLSARESY